MGRVCIYCALEHAALTYLPLLRRPLVHGDALGQEQDLVLGVHHPRHFPQRGPERVGGLVEACISCLCLGVFGR